MAKLKIDSEKNTKNFEKIAKAVYKVLGQKDNLKAEVVFMGKMEMQELNNSSRKVDSVTDVLSFPTLGGICGEVLNKKTFPLEVDGRHLFIGSIVLCEDKIKAQAKEYGHSEEREMTYLFIHGLLHLFGYDHIEENDKKIMREKEKEVLNLLGVQQ